MDIQIGEGNPGNSWIIYSKDIDFISQNDVSYLCKHSIFDGLEIIIMKNSKPGKHLTELLSKSKSKRLIGDFLTAAMLRNISVEDFNKNILISRDNWFKSGVKHNQKQMKEVLGVYNN